MAKAMLIMDMPNGCEGCQICQGIATDGDFVCSIRDKDGNEQGFYYGEYERPNHCPLREVPQYKPLDVDGISEFYAHVGFNQCLNEILRGGE